jgi:predicted secreted acid phosphatase
MFRRLLTVGAMTMLLVLSVMVAPTQAATMPSKQTWLNDTAKALSGSRTYVGQRVANTSGRLAINLDIDNTSLQTYYDRGKAIPATLRLVRYAKARGVSIFFNTGRPVSAHDSSIRQLRRAGFPVDGMCLKQRWESLSHSKRECRRFYVKKGFKLIANVGNRSTDFIGGYSTPAYKLPNYSNRLG